MKRILLTMLVGLCCLLPLRSFGQCTIESLTPIASVDMGDMICELTPFSIIADNLPMGVNLTANITGVDSYESPTNVITVNDILPPGIYNIVVTYWDPVNLCTSLAFPFNLTINQNPIPFGVTNQTRCGDGTVTFTANDPGANRVVEWSIDGGSVAGTGLTFETSVTVAGSPKPVQVRVMDNGTGCIGSWQQYQAIADDCGEPDPVDEPDARPSTLTAGNPSGQRGSADGPGTSASFFGLQGITYNPNSNLHYIADAFNHTIRMLTATENVNTWAGSAGNAGFVDGEFMDARFNLPSGMAFDAFNNLIYVADKGNHAIRVLDNSFGAVSTLAGGGAPGFADGTGSEALFNSPTDVALHDGFLYVVDHGNHSIRKIDVATGEVTTYLGNGTPGFADGSGTTARLRNPWGITTNPFGVLYITDYGNHCVRVAGGGNLTTTWGTNTPGFTDANGTAARFNRPTGISFSGSSQLYVADHNNRAIRVIDVIMEDVETISGNGMPGIQSGVRTRYLSPVGLATDGGSGILVIDAFSHQLRKIAP